MPNERRPTFLQADLESSSFLCIRCSSFYHRKMMKTDLKLILSSPSSWPDLTTIKRRRDRRKLFYGGDIISALMPPSGNKNLHVAMSMKMLTPKLSPSNNGAAMEKTIPPFPFTVAGEEKEIKLQYQEIWHGETLTLMTQSTRENLLKTMDSHSLQPPARCRRGREGNQRWWMAGGGGALGQESLSRVLPSFLWFGS